MPALIAHDIYRDRQNGTDSRQKLNAVLTGDRRTATLAYEDSKVKTAYRNLGWIAIKDALLFQDDLSAPWRVLRRNDPHHIFSGINVWSATRNLLKHPHDMPDERSVRIRERYTFIGPEKIDECDITKLLTENETPEDVLLGTATVYAINKLVPKPELHMPTTDEARFPAISEMRSSLRQR
jgi:hypothetical protein